MDKERGTDHVVRLGVLSDTHGNRARTIDAARWFRRQRVDTLIHCGDIGSPEIPDLLTGYTTHFVRGNVDSPSPALLAAVERGGHQWHDRCGSLAVAGKRIAFLHGDEPRRMREVIEGGDYDLVCHGHTHVAELYVVGSTTILNPGALHRSAEPSVALVDLPALTARIVCCCDFGTEGVLD